MKMMKDEETEQEEEEKSGGRVTSRPAWGQRVWEPAAGAFASQ